MADQTGDGERGGGDGGRTGPGPSFLDGLLRDAARTVLPVLLTGASLVGFVAFAGAVIVWTRFWAISVPAEQAVKAVPRSELVATGSSVLLLFGFFGVLSIVAAFLVDRSGRPTPGMCRALLGLLAVEGATAIGTFADHWNGTTTIAVAIFLVLALVAFLAMFHEFFACYVDELPSRPEETLDPYRGPGPLRTEENEPRATRGELLALGASVVAVALFAAALLFAFPNHRLVASTVAVVLTAFAIVQLRPWRPGATIARSIRREQDARRAKHERQYAEREVARRARERAKRQRLQDCEAEPEHDRDCADVREQARLERRRPHRLKMTPAGIVAFTALAALGIAAPSALIGRGLLAVPLAGAMVLGIGVWRIALLSRLGYMWFGLALFISVPLFGTLMLMAHNVADPQVQPMALIRSSDGPGEAIQGIYVTEGSDRIYFANVATEGCENKLEKDSGRLLWVPKTEVVAMSVGPLQDIDDAGRAALEMAYSLTPDVESPTGEPIELGSTAAAGETAPIAGQPAGTLTVHGAAGEPIADGEGAQAGGEGDNAATAGDEGPGAAGGDSSGEPESPEGAEVGSEAEGVASGGDHRLETAGPAVRPNFGAGLKLVPASAEPGDAVELRMSAPGRRVDEDGQPVEGFGPAPAGYNLRLNGVRLAIMRVRARNAERAEYVETIDGRVLNLVPYPGEGVLHKRVVRDQDDKATAEWFVRLGEDSVSKVKDGSSVERGLSIKLSPKSPLGPERTLAPLEIDPETDMPAPPSVILANGEEVALKYGLLRRAWSPTRVKFRIPDNAKSGVISVECGQLAGQPVLDVVHPPIAHVAVRMRPGSERVVFDSSHSVDEETSALTRRWTIAGRHMGDKPKASTVLPPRLAPYAVRLTITDRSGLSDTVELHLLRLPSSRFPFGSDRPKGKKNVRRVREALRAALAKERPVTVELDGHADAVGDEAENFTLSLQRIESLRERLFKPAKAAKAEADRRLVNGGTPIPMLIRAFGETCPIVHRPGPQPVNRRVEVFLLGPGATVSAGKHCHPGRVKRIGW